jgi:stearoyl-CoA desaturase (delta-9 desaturase)
MYLKQIFNHYGIKIRILQYIFFVSTVYSLFILPLSWLFLAFICYAFLVSFGGNIGLHRYFCHNSFKTSKIWHNILLFFSHYIGVGSVISWVGQHRHHHLNADTKNDVHSPYTNNMIKVFFGLWNISISKYLIKDVYKNESLKLFHTFYFKFHIFIIIFWLSLDLLFGSYLFLACYAIPNFLCLMSGYILATITHYHGYKNFKVNDNSTNSWIANILTLGEGWHNNHHFNPKNPNTRIKWWEFDLQFQIIKLIKNND